MAALWQPSKLRNGAVYYMTNPYEGRTGGTFHSVAGTRCWGTTSPRVGYQCAWRVQEAQSCSPRAIRMAVARAGPTGLVLIRLADMPMAVEPYQHGLRFRPTAWEDIQGPKQSCTARAEARCCHSYSAVGTQGSLIKANWDTWMPALIVP